MTVTSASKTVMSADDKMIYLDNNATTTMPSDVMKSMLKWCNMGNPSAGYASAKRCRDMMTAFREYIGKICGIKTCCPEDRDIEIHNMVASRCDPSQYKVIFTSGASEGNATILTSVVNAYSDVHKVVPHIVMGATEHKGLILMAESLRDRGCATVTFVNPTNSGHTLASDIEDAITSATCIVCVMHANNETGAINDITEIGRIAHKYRIPFHCDCVQMFGKFPLQPITQNVDSFCVSFHKFHGPPGVGAIVIKQQLIIGYKLKPIIFGSQMDGYRGGTENIPGIGGAFTALKYTMRDRGIKNTNMLKLKHYIISKLATILPVRDYTDYMKYEGGDIEIVILSMHDNNKYLPNTILLSVVKRIGTFICNTDLKKYLENNGVVVSVGSACNTASPKASHVLYSMGADQYIRKGALRISLGDHTTLAECNTFIAVFAEAVMIQLKDIR